MGARRPVALRSFLLVCLLFLIERAWGQEQQQLYRYQPGGAQQRRRYGGPNALDVGRENKRAAYLATALGFLGGYWLSGWSLRAKNKKTKQKYEKEIAQQEKRIEDAIKSIREQYEGVLEKKQEEYVEKYRHLQYIENALTEAGIPIDLSMASAPSSMGGGKGSAASSLEQDYAEFKQPDADGDDRISRKEFNNYMKQYLKANPEYSQYDYPSFEEFDVNNDGFVSFNEWRRYIEEAEQAAQAQDALYYQELQRQQQQKKGGATGKRRK